MNFQVSDYKCDHLPSIIIIIIQYACFILFTCFYFPIFWLFVSIKFSFIVNATLSYTTFEKHV